MKLRHMRDSKLPRSQQRGIALFMVMSTLAVLSVVVSELTYSGHIQQRLAYNYVDGLKAFYMAKAGLRFSLLRLRAYQQVQQFLGDEKNRALSSLVDQSVIEKIWNMPFVFPIPAPEDAMPSVSDAIQKFNSKSSLEGSFQIQITSESSRMNLNNLLVTTPQASPSASPSANPSPQASRSTTANTNTNPNPNSSPAGDINFKPLLEETLNSLLNRRRDSDREFAETYRNITGKDLADAIHFYMKQDPNNPERPNLPGIEKMIPKNAPLYTLGELHFINGLDDTLYDLIAPHLTVFSTPGVNINTAGKNVIWSLIPQMTEDEINELMKSRDDPETGRLFENEEKFWEAIKRTSAAPRVDAIKESLQKAGVRLVTSEKSFKITVSGLVGLSNRTIEAYVILGPSNRPNSGNNPGNGNSNAPPAGQTNPNGNPQTRNNPQNSSANNSEELQLVYWRVY